MGYHLVTVNPLKPFPIASFGLANVTSLGDAKKQIENKKVGDEKVAMLEARWAEGKIEPALKLHLARQERRLVHFNASCRFLGCDNPHPLGSPYFRRFGRDASSGSSVPKSTLKTSVKGTKRHSPQFFCGSHRWLKSQLKTEDYARISDPQYRIKVV